MTAFRPRQDLSSTAHVEENDGGDPNDVKTLLAANRQSVANSAPPIHYPSYGTRRLKRFLSWLATLALLNGTMYLLGAYLGWGLLTTVYIGAAMTILSAGFSWIFWVCCK